tara:strand:+ start:235 stop:1515 length:1281 start_codon:yes stop_codon:yes gene_type:complete
MKKLLFLLVFIPLVSFGQVSHFKHIDIDTIYYEPLVKYYAKEKESKIEKRFMNKRSRDGALLGSTYESPRDEIVESETKQKKHIITYRNFFEESTDLHMAVMPLMVTKEWHQKYYTKRSYYRDGSRARHERRILDVKNTTSDYFKEWVWSGGPANNHYGYFIGNRVFEMDYDYYVYDGITTIYSTSGGWMYKYFWISGWYIDRWQNNDERQRANHVLAHIDDFSRLAQQGLNRELQYEQENIVDYYNIESLVKIFIEDCINNNLILPFFDFKWLEIEEYLEPKKDGTPYKDEDFITDPGTPPGYIDWTIRFIPKIKATFESLEGNSIALSSGYMDDRNIIIKIDPEMWEKSSLVKRWYILYHELGHDILNLNHGEGGKMMFNFINKEYTWDDFIKDRETMFNIYKSKYDIMLERKKNQITYYKPKS